MSHEAAMLMFLMLEPLLAAYPIIRKDVGQADLAVEVSPKGNVQQLDIRKDVLETEAAPAYVTYADEFILGVDSQGGVLGLSAATNTARSTIPFNATGNLSVKLAAVTANWGPYGYAWGRDESGYAWTGHPSVVAGTASLLTNSWIWVKDDSSLRFLQLDAGKSEVYGVALNGSIFFRFVDSSSPWTMLYSPYNVSDMAQPAYFNSNCAPPNITDSPQGYIDEFRGWYDTQGCGTCNDYCRWSTVKTGITPIEFCHQSDASGGNPSLATTGISSLATSGCARVWLCTLGGSGSIVSYAGQTFTDTFGWSWKQCRGNSITPSGSVCGNTTVCPFNTSCRGASNTSYTCNTACIGSGTCTKLPNCSAYTCPDLTVPVLNSSQVVGSSAQACCKAYCILYDCPNGYNLIYNSSSVLGSDRSTCCNKAGPSFLQMKHVSVGIKSIWALDRVGFVYSCTRPCKAINGTTLYQEDGHGWDPAFAPGNDVQRFNQLTDFHVSPAGSVGITPTSGTVIYRATITDPDTLQSVSLANLPPYQIVKATYAGSSWIWFLTNATTDNVYKCLGPCDGVVNPLIPVGTFLQTLGG